MMQITAIAVDPSGKRVAVIGSNQSLDRANMFLLDAFTGEQASQRRYLHEGNYNHL